MTVLRNTGELKDVLSDLDFPADKDDVVAHAEQRGAGREVASALRAMPPAQYNQVEEVLRAVPLADPEVEDRSGTEGAQQRKGRSGVAEHLRSAEPSAIEDELGENRGS